MKSCDTYILLTHGPGPVDRWVIALSKTIADVATLGFAEIVFLTVEADTLDDPDTVVMCFTPENTLMTVDDRPPV